MTCGPPGVPIGIPPPIGDAMILAPPGEGCMLPPWGVKPACCCWGSVAARFRCAPRTDCTCDVDNPCLSESPRHNNALNYVSSLCVFRCPSSCPRPSICVLRCVDVSSVCVPAFPLSRVTRVIYLPKDCGFLSHGKAKEKVGSAVWGPYPPLISEKKQLNVCAGRPDDEIPDLFV
jgi:hypothetical protein